jgi:outer membrane protein OmpA-like peptidoglycan-associated protein
MNIRMIFLVTLAAAFAACTSIPERNSALDQARTTFNAAQNNPQVATLAPEELKRAADSLRVAEQAATDHAATATVNHLAYMTVQRVTIANDTASSKASQAVTAGAAAERDKLLLAVRTNEADMAQQQLALSEQSNARKSNELATADANAERDQMQLALSTHETATAQQAADTAEQHLALSEQSNAQKTSELAEADATASRSNARVSDLESQLKDLNAKKTDRGMVVTLGDVLFDTGKSQVLASASSNIAKLADFFKRNPQRTALIEGFTDNVGIPSANFDLSQRRADAVMTALIGMGVPADRLSTQAHGEDMPTADNDTAAGRQMNRRVEIVIAPRTEDVSMMQ